MMPLQQSHPHLPQHLTEDPRRDLGFRHPQILLPVAQGFPFSAAGEHRREARWQKEFPAGDA
jgi:hypothetical protein